MGDDADTTSGDGGSSDTDLSRPSEAAAGDDDLGAALGPEGEAGDDVVYAPQGAGSRFADSFGALVAGLIIIPFACFLLFWNEGHAIHVARALDEVQRVVRTIPTDRLDPANTGQAVHLAGQTESARGVSDEAFGVHAKGLKLVRSVEMYQWKEKESGSGNDRKYTYSREWNNSPVSSSGFHAQSGHQNPAFPGYRDRDFGAADARIGAVPIGSAAVLRLGGGDDYAVAIDEAGRAAARRTAGPALKVSGGGFYVGENPDSPRVGDVRVTYRMVPEETASFIGRQQATGLDGYRASNGEEILLAYAGTHSAEAVVAKGQDDNRLMAWIWRAVGLLVMLIGFVCLFAPINLLTSYVPFLGSIVAGATTLVAFVATLALGTTVIAVAWLAYRPLIAGGAIAGAVLMVAALRYLRRPRRPAPALAPA